jgi:hypothetical protein
VTWQLVASNLRPGLWHDVGVRAGRRSLCGQVVVLVVLLSGCKKVAPAGVPRPEPAPTQPRPPTPGGPSEQTGLDRRLAQLAACGVTLAPGKTRNDVLAALESQAAAPDPLLLMAVL